MLREVRYSNPGREIGIAMLVLIIVIVGSYLYDPDILSFRGYNYSGVIALGIYLILRWSIWKLAGGYTE